MELCQRFVFHILFNIERVSVSIRLSKGYPHTSILLDIHSLSIFFDRNKSSIYLSNSFNL